MSKISEIVNLKKHPFIKSNDFVKSCRTRLVKNSILQLDNFLTAKCLLSIQKEALKLKKNAFYCSQKHTILLNKKNPKISNNDPINIEVISDKGCVPHDLIPKNSLLNSLYKSIEFKKFLTKILEVKQIYPYKDKLSSINYNYYEKTQQLGWHFDNASFAITLMIQSPTSGGVFEYTNKGRNYENNYINKKFISKIINGKIDIEKLNVKAGTLILFYGRNYLHRVTPVTSNKPRILITLNYNLEKGIELSKNARKTFFGRI
tara:strand:- start:359 stop:1141 length:783 start_codon:yes stop_codon:yes gene_type:complete